MKNLLLSIFFLAVCVSSYSQGMQKLYAPENQASDYTPSPAKAVSEKFNIQFCGNDVGGWVGYTPDVAKEITAYLYISPERATQLAGNKITGFTLSVVVGEDPVNDKDATVKGTVFVSEDLNEEPVSKMNMTYRNAYHLTNFLQTAQFSKSKQYVIKENTGFYFGFTIDVTTTVRLGFDKLVANDEFSGNLKITYANGETEEVQGKNLFEGQDKLYHNLMFYAMTEGTAAPSDNFSIGKFKIADWPEPTFDAAHVRPMLVEVENKGTTAITSVEYSYWFESDPTVRKATAEANLAAGETGWLELPVEYIQGRSTLTVRVDKLNDVSVSQLGKSTFFYLGEKGYPAKFVVEKYTGQNCGYCPRGIYGFEWMSKNHPEDFLGIAIMNYGSDVYRCLSYSPFASSFTGAPQGIVNRMAEYTTVLPDRLVLEEIYQKWKGHMSNALVELKVDANSSAINITSETTFAVDDEHSYRLAYVVLEDDLHGRQFNNYAGSKDNSGVLGGWNEKGQLVPWDYQHVAREIVDALGYYESTIITPKEGSTHTCSLTIDPRCLYNGDLSKGYIYALLIDVTTGQITTAGVSPLVEGGHGAISGIDAEDAEPTYYNIQGIRVDNPEPGHLYIKKQGEKATKVIF